MHAHFNPAILTGLALLRSAAHHVGHRHARDADRRHGVTQRAEAILIAEDTDEGIALFPDRRLSQAG